MVFSITIIQKITLPEVRNVGYIESIRIIKSCLESLRREKMGENSVDSLKEALAFSYLSLGRFNLANKIYSELYIKYPNKIVFLYNLGLSYGGQGKREDLLKIFEKILSKEPEYYFDVVQYIDSHPESVHNLFGLAILYHLTSRTIEVTKIYKKLKLIDSVWADRLKICTNNEIMLNKTDKIDLEELQDNLKVKIND